MLSANLTPIDIDDIPERNYGKKPGLGKWAKVIHSFWESYREAAEVSTTNASSTHTVLGNNLRNLGLAEKIKVVRRGDRLFLVRTVPVLDGKASSK